MELGLDFDDSDFTEKVREKETLTSYNAKVCYPEWFFSDRADNGRNDMATVYKFRGDYHYRRKDLKSAIQCYKNSLDRLGIHNRTMRRELMESLARCHMQNKDFEMSKKYAEHVMSDCLTVENYCHTLMLQQQLYRCSGDLLSELRVLHQLITLHPVNAQFWLKLIDLYEKIRESCNTQHDESSMKILDEMDKYTSELKEDVIVNQKNTDNEKMGSCEKCRVNTQNCEKSKECASHVCCTQCIKQNTYMKCTGICPIDKLHQVSLNETKGKEMNQSGTEHLNQALSAYPVDLALLTCYIRARLILSGVQGTVGSFIKDRNIQLVDMLNKKIQDLKVQDSVLENVTQYIRHDMFEEDADDSESKPDQNQDIKVVMENVVTTEDFNTRWFSWIRAVP
ncbi:uncharacterized protein C8orf76 homolog [Mercenaria mercenaria]|uniref:uncharacterized protein C8orf76 homolog n=1 Tax=Mercenaria mercenaria TaxID=6596 RepID=UPI00234E4B2A|nr:uncharacterized protein C8orf76 homolog [Mercenaria mercenaria]XP_045157922.2 uncharacterized protein C8orf76 homolog [Mercenaria mercenaria]XP_045157923.2 uncharacterized protein C8orf76 homolog [Mercenaria mercenaria]XP_045157924.2 uncharacterized protein C8orf76 homolog [Mercenaria mercenaria]XP_045157925.2 uncharacterized protein C8orf76 homolog [Mercenaria mercenaria]XP_045157926.2 uncharacterized protein C8orf76 homolog [Mercenaria mercenaria]XP_045157927.2 uncharacterized protein C8